jgi:hypothetical protein
MPTQVLEALEGLGPTMGTVQVPVIPVNRASVPTST